MKKWALWESNVSIKKKNYYWIQLRQIFEKYAHLIFIINYRLHWNHIYLQFSLHVKWRFLARTVFIACVLLSYYLCLSKTDVDINIFIIIMTTCVLRHYGIYFVHSNIAIVYSCDIRVWQFSNTLQKIDMILCRLWLCK